jgi:D-3-phosphoglycerate dehydrogenase
MASYRALITSLRLRPGDEAVRKLEEADIEPVFEYWHGDRTEEELLGIVGDVDAILAWIDPFTRRVIEAAPRLKVICRTGIGVDSVDVEAATERGVAVCMTPGSNRHAVSEYAMALILMCSRQLPANLGVIRSGEWKTYMGVDLAESTLGIVGLGSIGREVAQRARGFEMRILAHDTKEDKVFADAFGITHVPLDQLLHESDFVTLHLGLSEQSRGLIDAEKLSLMKPTAYLINTARGPIVDERALYEALKERRIAGAALDVFEQEPLPKDSPLLQLDNIYLTPHAAGSTVNAALATAGMAVDSVIKLLRGERPVGVVNPQVLG